MRMGKYTLLVLILLTGLSKAGHADTFLYSATYDLFIQVGSFSFTEPAILSTDTIIPVESLLTHTNTPGTVTQVEINPTAATCTGMTFGAPFTSCLGVYFSDSSTEVQPFITPFTKPGTYSMGETNGATLTITDISATVPEPGTLSLLSLGIVGAGSVFRRLRRC